MAIGRGEIDAQLQEIGEGERWWEQREFRDLPHILHPDERIRGITRGRILGRRRPRMPIAAGWLLVATDQRLICLRQERFARKQIDIAPGQVVRVLQKSRIRNHQLTIQTPQRRYRIRIPKSDAFRFTGALAALIPQPTARRIHPELEPLSWIPGMTTVASLPGVAGIFSMLSPPDPTPHRTRLERLEGTVERLEADVDRLKQQVSFLEDLLEKRAQAALIAASEES